MAISGLHFSIIATFLGLILGLFVSRKIASVTMIILMSAYFIFLGTSPSVTRAWIAIMLALMSLLLGKRSSGLNALGIGILVVVLWDPLAMREVGFQFSFAVTAAILLWYAPCDVLLQKWTPGINMDIASSIFYVKVWLFALPSTSLPCHSPFIIFMCSL
jgi:competence protein ComEC